MRWKAQRAAAGPQRCAGRPGAHPERPVLMYRAKQCSPSVHQCAGAAHEESPAEPMQWLDPQPARRSVAAFGACTVWSALQARASRCPLLFRREHKTAAGSAARWAAAKARWPLSDRQSNGGPSSSAGEGRRWRRRRQSGEPHAAYCHGCWSHSCMPNAATLPHRW